LSDKSQLFLNLSPFHFPNLLHYRWTSLRLFHFLHLYPFPFPFTFHFHFHWTIHRLNPFLNCLLGDMFVGKLPKQFDF
jgi:hypothetical protein